MIRFAIKTGIFAGFLYLTIWMIGKADNLDHEYTGNHNIHRLKLAAAHDSLDILFIGNSYTYSSIMPSAFDSLGLKTFNLGTASAGPLFYEIILDDYLEGSNQYPKTVAFTISPTTFSILSDNFEAYPIHRYLEKPLSNEFVAIQAGSPILYAHLIQKSAKKGADNLIGIVENEATTKTITRRGFYPNRKEFSDSVYEATKEFYTPLKNANFNNLKAKRLLSLAAELEKKGVNLIFLEVPTNCIEEFFPGAFLKNYNQFKIRLRSEYPLISYPKEIPPSFYRNIDHMNLEGAKIYSKFLTRENLGW